MKNSAKYCFLLLSIICGFGVKAQTNLKSDTFKVVKEYKPLLIDVDKISFNPEINDTFKINTDLEYRFIHKPQHVSFTPEKISAARIKGEPLVKLYNGYAKVGVGNSLIPFADVYYSNQRSKEYAIGAQAKYFNQSELNEYEKSGFSKAHVEVFGKRFWKANTLEGKLYYDHHDFNYYGLYETPQISFSELNEENLNQTYSSIGGAFRLVTTKQDSFNIRHDVSAQFNHLTNASSASELQIVANGNLSQIVDTDLYELDLIADYSKYELGQESGIFAAKPQISTSGQRFKIKAGLGIYANINSETNFHFYPLAEVKYDVIDDILIPYAGIKGEVKRNNYRSITQENPFVNEQLNLLSTNEKYNIYAGLRGTLSKQISFNTSVARVNSENAHFYIKPSFGNQILAKEFNLIYDDLQEWQIKGELIYRLNEKIRLFALGEYFAFETDQIAEAWHRPEVKVSTSALYNLKDKIIAKVDLFYWGKQYAQGVNEVTVNQAGDIIDRSYFVEELAPIFDANLSFEYRYTKKLSAFLQFNNLLGINYQKYQDYPLQGFNFWGGLTYSF